MNGFTLVFFHTYSTAIYLSSGLGGRLNGVQQRERVEKNTGWKKI